jgi:predicted transcriptional regulator
MAYLATEQSFAQEEFCIQNEKMWADMNVIEILELLETRCGMKPRDICKLAEIDYSTLWRWKHGKSRPTKPRRQKLLAGLANADR